MAGDQKTFKQKQLSQLQYNIAQKPELYKNDFYNEFDKFLLNFSIVLLNPYKKNDLFCSQVIFLGCFSSYYSRAKEDGNYTFADIEEDTESLYDIDIEEFEKEEGVVDEEKEEKKEEEEEEEEEEMDIEKNLYRNKEKMNRTNVDTTSAEELEHAYEYKLEENLMKNLELKKKQWLQTQGKKVEKENLKKKDESPLIIYEDLNEYINMLMVKNKEEVHFLEEVFFLISQLLIQLKHKLYCTVLLSCLRALTKIRTRIDPVKYIQVLMFLHDIKSNRLKSYNFFNMVRLIVRINRKGKDEELKNKILCLLHEAFIENSQRKKILRKYSTLNFCYFSHMTIPAEMNNFACSILIELAKKKIYINRKNVNILSEGIFYKNMKIVKCICYVLLGKHTNKELIVKIEKEKIKKRDYLEELKHINNKSHTKLTKSKIKQLHEQKSEIMASIAKEQNISEDEDEKLEKEISKYVDFTFIDLIYDIHKYATSLFNLICSKYKHSCGVIKFLFLNILCKIYQRNRIVEDNFFLYFENCIFHIKSKNILSKYLSIFIQCIHDAIPEIYIQRIIYVLIKRFVCEYLSEEIVYLAINAINEMILKRPACLNEEIYEGIIIFQKYKNKNIGQVVKRFVNICKQLQPGIVDKKLLDKNTAILLQKKKLLGNETSAYENSVLQYAYLLNKLKKEKGQETTKKTEKNKSKGANNQHAEDKKEKKRKREEHSAEEAVKEIITKTRKISDLEHGIDEEKNTNSEEKREQTQIRHKQNKRGKKNEDAGEESDANSDAKSDAFSEEEDDGSENVEGEVSETHELNEEVDTTDDLDGSELEEIIEDDNMTYEGESNESNDDEEMENSSIDADENEPEYESDDELELMENNGEQYRSDVKEKRQKPDKRLRREKRKQEELEKEKKTETVLCERILDENDFKKLRKMKAYIESNTNVVLSELQEFCELTSDSENENDDTDSEDGREQVITDKDLMCKKKLKKGEMINTNKETKNKKTVERFKTNKEKERNKPIMMVCEKKRKKRNFMIEYGRLKRKLKGKKGARARKNRFMNRRAARTLRRRAR